MEREGLPLSGGGSAEGGGGGSEGVRIPASQKNTRGEEHAAGG